MSPKIPGDYQYRANYLGPVLQRFWHHQRKLLIDKYLALKPGDRVLDAGCGSGVFADYMIRKGALVWGVDLNQDAIDFARRTFQMKNMTFLCQAIDRVTLPDSSINKILLSEVLEHLTLSYQEAVVAELDRILVPGGLVLVTAPNYRSLWPWVERVVDLLHLVHPLKEQHLVHTSVAFFHRCALNGFFTLRTAGCFNYLAPVVALFNWGLAEQAAMLEFRIPMPGGLQVYAVWQKIS